MADWEREVFEKEFADLNWYKGKQAKHVKEMELARKRSKLGALNMRHPHLCSLMLVYSVNSFTAGDIQSGGGVRARTA